MQTFRTAAIVMALALLLTAFTAFVGGDSGPAGDINLALDSTPTASSTISMFPVTNMKDGNLATMWMCGSYSKCWVALKFPQVRTFDEVDIHMEPTKIIKSLNVYADKNSDGKYSSSELVKAVSGNTKAVLIVPLPRTAALSVKLSDIVMTTSSTYARILEVEIYLRDKDMDGLPNGFEVSKGYSQQAASSEVPLQIPDDGENISSTSIRLLPWAGTVASARADFTVDHADPGQLAVALGYWNGTAWIERFIWNPGGHAAVPTLSVSPSGHIRGFVTFTAASTNGVPIAEARFYRDGALQFTDLDGAPFGWTWDTTPFAERSYQIEVVAFDQSRNAVSRTFSVVVDNSLPVATMIAPVGGQLLTGTVAVRVSASDANDIARVEYYIDAETVPRAVVTGRTGGEFVWYWDTTLDKDGTHTVKAKVFDPAGNQVARSVSVTVVNGGPTVTILDPPAHAFVPGIDVVVVSAPNIQPAYVFFFVDGSLAGYTSTRSPIDGYYYWFWITSSLSDGYHFLSAKAYDAAGKSGGHSIPVRIDRTPPAVRIVAPSEGDHLRGTVTVRATAIDSNGISYVDFYVDGQYKARVGQPDATGTYPWTWDTLLSPASTPYRTIKAIAKDIPGNTFANETRVVVDNAAPTIAITSPTYGQQVSGVWQVIVNVSDGVGVATVSFALDGVTKFVDDAAPFAWHWDTTQTVDGFHTLQATSADRAGNSAPYSISVCVSNTAGCGGGGGGGGGGGRIYLLSVDLEASNVSSTLIAGRKDVTLDTQPSSFDALNFDGTPVTQYVIGPSAMLASAGGGGASTHIVVDLLKHIRELTGAENASGILAPDFAPETFLQHQRWRLVVMDHVAGTSGQLSDFRIELAVSSDPLVADTDGDGLTDGEEVRVADLNGDGSIGADEIAELKSLPVAKDSDADGLNDFEETRTYFTSPLLEDTDGDEIWDSDEIHQFFVLTSTSLAKTVLPSGSATTTFEVPVAGYYIVKFLATTTLVRDAGFLGTHDISETAFIEAANDDLFRSLLTLSVDGGVVTGDTQGNLTSVRRVGASVEMNESRYFFIWEQTKQYTVGSHSVGLQLSSYAGTLEVRLYTLEVRKQGLGALTRDVDSDGLSDGEEIRLKTNPLRVDSDGDGLWDGANGLGVGEKPRGTDPLRVDTDGDGLWDGANVGNALGESTQGTDPLRVDSDGDGLWDGYDVGANRGELTRGTSPTNADTDSDTMLDGWEVSYGLNPTANDGAGDLDADGLANNREYTAETEPTVRDTDRDNLTDQAETSYVLLRTNIVDGARSVANYAAAGDWIAYLRGPNSFRYDFAAAYTNQPASATANSASPSNEIVARLADGSLILYHLTLREIYVWQPGADHGDKDANLSGDGVLQGTYYRFVFTNIAQPFLGPLAGYRGRELYRGTDRLVPDTDHDGLLDGDEVSYGLDTDSDGLVNNVDYDSDNDGLPDGSEPAWASDTDGDGLRNMVDADSDGDGIRDGTELGWGDDTDLDGRVNALDTDSDADTVLDGQEDRNLDGATQPSETSPVSADTDADGISDPNELRPYEDADADGFVNANDLDSDNDAISDSQEPSKYVDTDGDGAVNAYDADSDSDGAMDGQEIGLGTEILAPDTDGDLLLDGPDAVVLAGSVADQWFASFGLKGRADVGGTVRYFGEQTLGTEPTLADTDSDGLSDGAEKLRFGTDPLARDSDSDNLTDRDEANDRVYWFEAEGYVDGGAPPSSDPDLATSVQIRFTIPQSGWYKLYASVRGGSALCPSQASVVRLGVYRDDSSIIREELITLPCNGTLRWHSILAVSLTSGEIVRLRATDANGGGVLVDKIMFAQVGDMELVSTKLGTATFGAPATVVMYLTIPLTPGVPLYVTQATFTIAGDPVEREAIVDGSFESGGVGWYGSGCFGIAIGGQSGSRSAYIYAETSYGIRWCYSWIYQNVPIPSDARQATLRFYDWKTNGPCTYIVYADNDVLFTSTGTWSNWQYREFNLSKFIGDVVTVLFFLSCDVDFTYGYVFVDSVSLLVWDLYPVDPYLNVGDNTDVNFHQWDSRWSSPTGSEFRGNQTIMDLSGDFNRYIANHTDPTASSVTIPLWVHATGGKITITLVRLVLEPRVSDPVDPDTDSDGLWDGREKAVNASALLWDSDRDGWDDRYEADTAYNTCGADNLDRTSPADIDSEDDGIRDAIDPDPVSRDRDCDGLWDVLERTIGLNPDDPDTDNDGLLDGVEYYGKNGYATNPKAGDTDGDGLWDGWQDANGNRLFDAGETKGERGDGMAGTGWGTNPLRKDTDGDGIPDNIEVQFFGILDPTDPTDAGEDPDADGLTNLDEYSRSVAAGSFDIDGQPGPNFNDADDDGDGLPTLRELEFGLDPYRHGSFVDADGDGLSDLCEYLAQPLCGMGLDPADPDTDGDGLWDGWVDSNGDRVYNAGEEKGERGDGTATSRWGTDPLVPDTDGDGVLDGDEASGWYVYILRSDDTVEERFVASKPWLVDTDGDGLSDGREYLATDPTRSDTDGDGIGDRVDEDPVVQEDVPPKLGNPNPTYRLDWGWLLFVPVVVHTWLTVSVTATDNVRVSSVTFRLDNGAVQTDYSAEGTTYRVTFEIDFWNDYVLGWEMEIKASDPAGNIAGAMTGGGLEYVIGGLVAGFLAFLLGPEMAGGVLGFFVGFGTGLFEDLTIFLHIGEMWDAIRQLPVVIGRIIADPSILLQMIVDMVNQILAKANLMNPYGPSAMTAVDLAGHVVKFFWRLFDSSVQVPAFGKQDLFNLAFTVSHLVGYLIQQFVIGTGITKIVGKLNDVGKLAKLTNTLSDASKALRTAVDDVRKVAKIAAQGIGRPTAQRTLRSIAEMQLKLSDEAAAGAARVLSDLGPAKASAVLRQLSARGDDFAEDVLAKFGRASDDLKPKVSSLIKKLDSPSASVRKGAEAELDFFRKNFDAIEEVQLYRKLQSGTITKPDFRLADGTLAEIKSWSPELFKEEFFKKKLATQMNNYHELGAQQGWGGRVDLWLKGDLDASFLQDIKLNIATSLRVEVSQLDWLTIRTF